jgi:hypothetical protein
MQDGNWDDYHEGTIKTPFSITIDVFIILTLVVKATDNKIICLLLRKLDICTLIYCGRYCVSYLHRHNF